MCDGSTYPPAKRRRADGAGSGRFARRQFVYEDGQPSPFARISTLSQTCIHPDPTAPPRLWEWACAPRDGTTQDLSKWILVLGKPANPRCRRLLQAFREHYPGTAVLACSPTVLAPSTPGEGVPDFSFFTPEYPSTLPLPSCVVPCCKGRLVYRLIRLFELHGIESVNPSASLLRTYDKWSQYRALEHLMPPTVRVTDAEHAAVATREVARDPANPFPVVMKATQGSGGELVFLCNDDAELAEHFSSLSQGGKRVIVQQYIAESRGTDTRLYVVGGVVAAAMRRRAVSQTEFKANLAIGGSGERHEPSEAECELAIEAAERLGLGIAGVDILEGRDGPLLCEVNANPGVRIQRITRTDVGASVAALALRHAATGQYHRPGSLAEAFSSAVVQRLRSPAPTAAGVPAAGS
eukprot:TRINITY_DN46931_c0_g1_i1.p1 TRINITY_DN46931_c0_g1~~TRINITY_DN46931_c0_g1_i1.p1  ORF type:complete len:409 (+),score=55.40 TRINITY_DN46931_c0_g1_i1:61-1287(+)